MHNIYTKIISEIQKFLKTTNLERVVIGVSGGIDSALCLKLLVDALGAPKVTALIMPEKGVTSDENTKHAKTLCEFLKVEHYTIPINKFLMEMIVLPWKLSELAEMNAKARVRMMILYCYANTKNALVIGTSNKTELMLGYGTKYGDMGVDIDIIGDLLKEDVYKLSEHLGLPTEFLEKKPSAELYKGQTDEDELGMSYKEMDSVLRQIERGVSKEDIIGKGISPNVVHKIFRLMELNKHKLTSPHIIKAKA